MKDKILVVSNQFTIYSLVMNMYDETNHKYVWTMPLIDPHVFCFASFNSHKSQDATLFETLMWNDLASGGCVTWPWNLSTLLQKVAWK